MMTLAEFGLYNWLLMYGWANKSRPCFLENSPKKLALLIGQPLKEFLKTWVSIQKKFELWIDPQSQIEYFFNRRLFIEYNKRLAQAERQNERAEKAAQARWGNRQNGDATSIAQAYPQACTGAPSLSISKSNSPLTVHSSEKGIKPLANSSPKYPPDFEMFWANSTKRGSKLEAGKIWKSLKPDDELYKEIFAGMLNWRGSEQWQDETKQPHVCRWLKRRGWEEVVPRSIAAIRSERPQNVNDFI